MRGHMTAYGYSAGRSFRPQTSKNQHMRVVATFLPLALWLPY